MNLRYFSTTFLVVITLLLIAPATFFIVPQKAHADLPVVVTADVSPTTFTQVLKNTLTAANTFTTAIATKAQFINTYYLQPLAFILSGQLLKSMTSSIVAFVDGRTNGTGSPQFVQNLQGHMQNVGDVQAQAFLMQFNQNSNSPFASSITSALSRNYLQQTSLGGFFAQNQSTLNQYSPNPNAFVAGNWSQGGIRAWFALTTQEQNNPLTLYQNSQATMASTINGAQAARLSELNWGNGFLSWCGSNNLSNINSGSSAFGTPGGAFGTPGTTVGTPGTIFGPLGSNAFGSTGFGTSGTAGFGTPMDPCTNKNGTPGLVQTPGTVINGSLQNQLGTTAGKLVAMGNASAEINQIMGNIASVLGTVNFATQILGGPGSGGLFGAGANGGLAQQYGNSPNYFGINQSNVNQNTENLPFSGSDIANNITQYQSAWGTINTAAVSASTTVTNLISYCRTQSSLTTGTSTPNGAVISEAQTAFAIEIVPVFAQITTASSIVSAASAMVAQVQSEAASSNNGAGGAYAADLQTLEAMPPTATDVSNAQQQATVSNTATSSPPGSLSVSGGSIVDQMNLITTNAQVLQNSCTAPATH